ncbi:MAG: hypothetical protein II670_00640, partial [Alphaproteobacteria bacterium]|nr:hypothetical protein [Alphaproteobacteria bacterium]
VKRYNCNFTLFITAVIVSLSPPKKKQSPDRRRSLVSMTLDCGAQKKFYRCYNDTFKIWLSDIRSFCEISHQ